MISYLANPQRFMAFSRIAAPLAAAVAVGAFAVGVPWSLLFAPSDYLQGESVRILFIHVPAAALSLGLYVGMGAASLASLVWRHALADVAARAIAPVGATYAALCLITGALWGQPTWGAWWVWDARLTSMFVLFLTYLGYLALWAAIEDEARAARLAAILCLAGLVNIPIVRFSVEWWSTLHQPPSGDAMHPAFSAPLTVMFVAYAAAATALIFALMRADVFRRRALALRARRSATV